MPDGSIMVTRPARFARLAALGLLAAGLAAPSGAFAAQTGPTPGAQPTPAGTAPAGTSPAGSAPAAATAPAAPSATSGPADARIEARITQLHGELRITPAQASLWNDFAGVMRSNAKDADRALAARRAGFEQMDAVADLRSFANLAAQRSAGIERLVAPFTALYASFSPEQKQIADRAFRHFPGRDARRPR